MPMPLAQSIGLPPPTATITSQPLARYSSAPCITSSTRGLGDTAVYSTWAMPWRSRLASTSPTQPAACTPGSDTTSTRRAPKVAA
ncbi:hypothetical protein D3C80_1665670 [compost metagenome]